MNHKYNKLDNFDVSINIYVLGNIGVGKTSIITRFLQNKFYDNYTQTYTHTSYHKNIIIDSILYKLNIVDVSNTEIISESMLKNIVSSHAIIIVCDASDVHSLNSAYQWIDLINCVHTNNFPFIFFLINKIDIIEDYRYIKQFINNIKNKYTYQEVSAKLDLNINKAFEICIRNIKNIKLDPFNIPILTNSLLEDSKKDSICCSYCSIM